MNTAQLAQLFNIPANVEAVLMPLIVAVLVIQFFFIIFLWMRLGSLAKKYNAFMTGTPGVSLEDKLIELVNRARQQEESMKGLHFALRQLEQIHQNSVQQVGVVRFNAFPDAGSDLSFAIAVLDGNSNGFVLSSIYGRDESRVYAKPITQGKSEYLLTQEEEEAILRGLRK
ncbi:MAG: DUF4446 family protein [bacterium]|jgi:hypothetical protein